MKTKNKPLKTRDEIQKMAESNAWTNKDGKQVLINQVREANRESLHKNLWENQSVMALRERFQKLTGYDLADREEFPVHESTFSWKAVAQKFGYSSVETALQEADSSSSFTQVLRAGIQTLVNSSYQTVETTFESWVQVVNSTKSEEPYAPLHGLSFLREVGKQEKYGRSRAAGLDLKLKNRKYGTVFAVEHELLEDDQTGQFAKQVNLLGEYAKLAIEVIVYAKLAGVFTGGAVADYAGMDVPNTETKPAAESNYPYAAASSPMRGGGFNRPASYGALTNTNLQAGFIAQMSQKNLLGIKMMVNPNRILISPYHRFDAAVLLNSSFYPAGAQAAGVTGGAFAINVLESIAALTVSRFMFNNLGSADGNSKAWYLIDDKKPWFVAQIREAASVVQEAPNSGEDFEQDVVQWKLRLRCNADHIDPRFAWQGNDGSV